MLFGKEHVERYLETDGAEGHRWVNDTTVLILTTTGRRTGQQRHAPLIYREYDGDYLVVASKGGADQPPDWLRNLLAEPTVEVQVLADRFTARARPATEQEMPDMWRAMVQVWPDYEEYQRNTSRQIPVVVLSRL